MASDSVLTTPDTTLWLYQGTGRYEATFSRAEPRIFFKTTWQAGDKHQGLYLVHTAMG